MEQLLEAFGVDVRLIIIQIINFFLLLAALSYFLYTPVLKLLKEREEKIKKGIADAEAAARLKEESEGARKEMLAAAHKDAEALAARAHDAAKHEAARIVEEATRKADSIAADAIKAAEHLQRTARAESEAEIARLAVLGAEQVLRERN